MCAGGSNYGNQMAATTEENGKKKGLDVHMLTCSESALVEFHLNL